MKRSNFLFSIVLLTMLFTIMSPASAVDHSLYDEILNRYVKGGYFDYRAFDETENDRERLRKYLADMSTVRPETLSDDEQLAYWMNLYNAATIELIMRNYPLDSIRDLDGWFGSVFSKKFISVGERSLSLDNVEHDTIRERFDEPRIHFALVCAARSCPPIRDEAYVGDRLSEQLEDQTKIFLNSDKNEFNIDKDHLNMELSRILYWYSKDFDGKEGTADFLKDYLSEKKKTLIDQKNFSISYKSYSWKLNQAPGPYDQM